MRSTIVIIALSLLWRPYVASAQTVRTPSRDSSGVITEETERAIEKGLQWLAAQQNADGSFGSLSAYRKNVGIVSLCGMAFLASGSTPERGAYGDEVQKALEFVLASASPTGYILEEQPDYYQQHMYGHGFATLFLAEVYGTTEEPELLETLKKAVNLIIASQNELGGWRYHPVPDQADLSVTTCQMMALRAARNAGIAVPRETIERGVQYIRGCQNPDGGFRYQMTVGGESRFPLTAAAIVALHSAGEGDGPVIERALAFQARHLPEGPRRQAQPYYFYAHYYSVQAAWQADDEYWLTWYTAVRDQLISEQGNDDHWSNPWIGDEYATCMALIALQVPNNLLPIFER